MSIKKWPIKETCIEVLNAIDNGMRQILTDLNYFEAQHLHVKQLAARVAIQLN